MTDICTIQADGDALYISSSVHRTMPRQLYWFAPTFVPSESYFRLSMHMKRALMARGVQVDFLTPNFLTLPGDIQQQIAPDIGAGGTIFAGTCGAGWNIKLGRVWAFTMYEATRIPDIWVRNLNAGAERILVPCDWCAEAFYESLRSQAMHLPSDNIHVVPLGIDPQEFPYIERPERDTYTFVALGDRGTRKGWDLLLYAFGLAFGKPGDAHYKADARLILKLFHPSTSNLAHFHHVEDRRIRLWRENLPSMLPLYLQADCFVFPSRAEGWGLPPREAAATGLPVICTDYSGMAGDVENWGLPLAYTEVPAGDQYDGLGEWAQPSVEHLVELLRCCYENPDDAREVGRKGSRWLHANQTWGHSAAVFMEVAERWM